MRSSLTLPHARRPMLLVSLLAAGCSMFTNQNRDTADTTAHRADPLKAAAPLACPKPAGATEIAAVHANPDARRGAQRGLGFVAREASAWQEKNKCYGCHVQAVTLEALSIGRHNQYEIPKADMETIVR